MSENIFINREISWLDFNGRVLEEAASHDVPLLERLKFLAIFSNNLDEFFMVRVAGVNQQVRVGLNSADPSGITPKKLLVEIREKVTNLIKRQYKLLNDEILPQLSKKAFRIYSYKELENDAKHEVRNYFDRHVFSVLTPVAVDHSHPFPTLNNCTLEFGVTLKKKGRSKQLRALVEVPEVLPRFIRIKTLSNNNITAYIMIEDIIENNISSLFVKCEIIETFLFRLTRDMDFSIDDEGAADLLKEVELTLKKRKKRSPVRLEIPAHSKSSFRKWLIGKLNLPESAVYKLDGIMDLTSMFRMISEEARPDLLEPVWEPLSVSAFPDNKSVFDAIRENGSIPLFHPFQSFSPVIRFLEEAAEDPDVLAIKQTLYRVSGDSPIIHALQRAAENKKQVTVIVELKARFDEEQNIEWAKQLEESGAHVIYGIAGLKIHCKALLVIRREYGGIHRYAHLSTGNYNDKTARLYTDNGIFSDDSKLCTDITALFNIITGYSEFQSWMKIATAPQDLRDKFISLIEREKRLSTHHNPGRIIAKMNSLVDPVIITHLHKAAKAGVQIDLIVRGICCFKPDKTKNINVVSIVDRYLEHSRIFYFGNGGKPEYFMSSADWMPRNLDGRVEILFPVENKATRQIIDDILQFQLDDTKKGRRLGHDGIYTREKTDRKDSSGSQLKTYQLFKSMIEKSTRIRKKLTVFKSPSIER